MNASSLGPTTNSPSPKPAADDDFFGGSGHLRTLHHLEHAIAQDDRLMVLTGDEGVGKTTVVKRLLQGLDHRNAVWCVLLSATQLDTGELPGSLARAFGAPNMASAHDLRAALRRHLLALGKGRSVLAVVDDAQALPPEAIATLGEMIGDGQLRVLLVGRPGLRMLLQRQLALHPASLECHLEPLQDNETAAYVDFRLQRIARNAAPAFSNEAKVLMHRFSRGVPMRIDRLCDRLLRAARQRGLRTVGAEEVQRMARPRLDDALIPVLTSAVNDDDARPSSGWAASSANGDLPAPLFAGPGSSVATTAPPRRAGGVARRQHAGLVLLALVLGSALGVLAWRHFEPLRVDSTMTASPLPQPPPASSKAEAAEPPLATPAPAPRATSAPPAPPRTVGGTQVAPPKPVSSLCTAAVVALGLCTQIEKPP